VQTILLNLFFQGEISAMKPCQELFKGKLVVIRPLAYVEERELARYAREQGLRAVKCACPNAGNTQRAKVKNIIRDIERICPEVKTNIFKSVKRIKTEYLL